VDNEIAETGTQGDVVDLLTTWEGRNQITGLDEITELEKQYSVD
jgi:hypothetical protein